jgi:2-keto-4-pentenoate hydratase/2-oxohepta-3-ene-1,7-dioic acid hydratase in catechol pathway
MKLVTLVIGDEETAAVVFPEGFLPVREINRALGTGWPEEMLELLWSGELDRLVGWYRGISEGPDSPLPRLVGAADVAYAPPYRRPRKIWGIGLNYVEHAGDLSESAPSTEPASFMKPDTTIIGCGEEILLPEQSKRVTAEAELGVIIGRECRDVSEEDATSVIAGFTTIVDMTAEDILQRNPRYLTRAKSFDTFFSFGPEIITPDEIADLAELPVDTVLNGAIHRKNVVANMTFSPAFLVSFHSRVMTLLPGDIISTGTPGAAVIRDGDVVSCEIPGFATLTNPVKRRVKV